MKIGFLFPGQGAQVVGMGADLYNEYEEVRRVYDEVEKITGIDIKKISFEGPENILNETQNTQLAVLTESLAILSLLHKNKIKADAMAGLSLGEYTALIEDGVFDFETGIKIVKERGKIMHTFVPDGDWKMAAILGLDDDTVKKVCESVTEGFVVPVNFNTVGQVVISGYEESVDKASALAKEFGAKKVSVLKTEGPFHTSKMELCSVIFRKVLENSKINIKNSGVVKNLDGSFYSKNDDVVDVLSKHIMSPVHFSDCLKTMYRSGIDTFIEIGAGKALSGFVKRMKFESDIKIMNINNVETLKSVVKEVNKNE